ncbi:MAG: hypothetical protein AB7E80_04160 [Hyphomicrobiaceae bacterium]
MEIWLLDTIRAGGLLDAEQARHPRLAGDDASRLEGTDERLLARRRAHIALRCLLTRVTGDGRCDGVAFCRTPAGKPMLPAPLPAFSLSHSGGYALLAAAGAGDGIVSVGVDVEGHRDLRLDDHRRRRLVVAGAKIAGGRPVPIVHDDEAVLQAFVRIEACAKALGIGVMRLLTLLGVMGGDDMAPDQRAALAPAIAELVSVAWAHEDGAALPSLSIGDVELPPHGGDTLKGAVAYLGSASGWAEGPSKALVARRFPETADDLQAFFSSSFDG